MLCWFCCSFLAEAGSSRGSPCPGCQETTHPTGHPGSQRIASRSRALRSGLLGMRGGATSGVSTRLLLPPPAKISERLHGSSQDKRLKDCGLAAPWGKASSLSPQLRGWDARSACFPPACAPLGSPGSWLSLGSRGSSRPPLQDLYQRHERMLLRGRPLRSAARGRASRRRKDIMVYLIAQPEVLGSSPSSSQPSRGCHGVGVLKQRCPPAGSSGLVWIWGAVTAVFWMKVGFGHYCGCAHCFRVQKVKSICLL